MYQDFLSLYSHNYFPISFLTKLSESVADCNAKNLSTSAAILARSVVSSSLNSLLSSSSSLRRLASRSSTSLPKSIDWNDATDSLLLLRPPFTVPGITSVFIVLFPCNSFSQSNSISGSKLLSALPFEDGVEGELKKGIFNLLSKDGDCGRVSSIE